MKAAGAKILRGGAYKPRTSPYEFQGLGREGLRLLQLAKKETGLKIITEVLSEFDVEHVAESADILQIGARNTQNFRLLIECAKTGRPITDLQPYLGAFGHTLIMSEDMQEYVHSHPLDIENFDPEAGPRPFMLPPDVDPETLRGGPEVVFEGLVPKAGRYRAWTQFRRNNKIYTFAFTFAADSPK